MNHARVQELLGHLAELRSEHDRLVEKRAELLRQMNELASRQMELKALIQSERAKLKEPE